MPKGHSPKKIWLKICVWNPKNLPDLNSRAGKWDFFGPKISLRVGVLKKAEITPEAQGCPPQPAPLQKSPLQGIHPCQEIFTGYPSLSRSFYGISIPVKKFLQDISWIYPSLTRIFYRIFTPAKHMNQIFWYRFQMHINPTTTTTDLGVFIDIILKPCLAIVEGLTPVHWNNGLMVAIWACLGCKTSVFVKVILQSISELSLDV